MTIIRDAYEITSKASTAGISAATKALKGMASVSFGALKAGLQGVVGIGGRLIQFLGQLPQQFFFLQQMLMSLGGAFKSLIQAAAQVSPTLGVEMAQLSADLARLKNTALTALGKTLTPLIHALGLALEDKRFQAFFNLMVDKLGKALTIVSDIIINKGIPAAFKLLDPISQIADGVLKLFSAITSGQASIGSFLDFLRTLEKATGLNLGSGLVGNIITLIESIRSTQKGLKSRGESLLQSVLGDLLDPKAISALQSVIEGNFAPLGQYILGALGNLWTNTLLPGIGNLWTQFKQWVLGGTSTAANGLTVSTGGGIISQLASALVQAGSDPATKTQLGGMGQTIARLIIDGIRAFFAVGAEIVKFLGEVISQIFQELSKPEVQEALKNLGLSIAQGILKGIEAGLQGAWAGLQGAWNALLGTRPAGNYPGVRQGLPSHENGIDFVPRTGPAFLHRGERVISAEQNRIFNRFGDTNTFNVSDWRTWQLMQDQARRQQLQAWYGS